MLAGYLRRSHPERAPGYEPPNETHFELAVGAASCSGGELRASSASGVGERLVRCVRGGGSHASGGVRECARGGGMARAQLKRRSRAWSGAAGRETGRVDGFARAVRRSHER
eukprot:6498643-Prymnesium_polylepis.2